jgi:hypothetical protein
MKIEIKSHYWPNTPELREIKLFIDDKEIASSFMNQDEVWDLANQLRHLDQYLMEIEINI